MNKDQIKGQGEQVKGHIKEAAGKLVGNDRLAAEGKLDQGKGKIQSTYGDAKENVKKAVDKV